MNLCLYTATFLPTIGGAELVLHELASALMAQGHDVSVVEAIYHVVEHFSGHAGQIIFITKAVTREDLGFYSYLASGRSGGRVP